jgi:Effector protein
MTYSQFLQPIENATRVTTKYDGIYIVEDPEQPFFVAIVREALDALNGKPSGKALLQAIASATPADNRGYKILIQRVSISYKMVVHDGEPRGYKATASGGRSFASPAQQSIGYSSSGASDGKGASVIVGWCQNQISYTAKVGANAGKAHYVPPPVTIGHELIHGLHCLLGTSKSGTSIKVDGKDVSHEEAQTVGLGPYAGHALTENKLRSDFKLPDRLSYP